MNDGYQKLIHKNERKYYFFALLISIATYIALIVSIIGIVYVALFLAVSLLLHALMLGNIRTNGVRLNQEQFPEVYNKVKDLCVRMEMKFVPDVYVMESSGALNAFATRFFGRNMVVLYSTIFELHEEGGEDELAFVIAHELAHIKRRHISRQLAVLPALWIPGIREAYSRACEYTCDRFAAYYTGNSEAAKNCLTMFGVGKSLSKRVNRASYLNQINEEKGFVIWLSEKFSTHPPLPKRIYEIGLFMGDADPSVTIHRSRKPLIWASAAALVIALLIGGAIFAIQKLDLEALASEAVMNSNVADTTHQPLINAVIDGDIEQLSGLLVAGGDIDHQDSDGWTALHWAVQTSFTEGIEILIESGADPNLEDSYGMVPLMTAARDGNVETVQMLLESGADINYQDYDGWTPLIYAVSNERVEIVQGLLDAGADAELTDYEDSNALMYAIKQGNQEILNILEYDN
jgi:ankyrin repeat protein/Zn-dependent protease with chaperone function